MKRDDYYGHAKSLREQVTKGLEKSNKVKLGDGYLVRIPKIQGRINRIKRDDRTYVEYIYERGYDPETKQRKYKNRVRLVRLYLFDSTENIEVCRKGN